MAIRLAGKRFNYILEDDRACDQPTQFIIRELNAIDRNDIFDAFVDTVRLAELAQSKRLTKAAKDELRELIKAVHASQFRICHAGIAAVTGILDADGQPVDLSAGEVIDQIKDPAIIEELAAAVLTRNALGASEKKDSVTPPSSPDPDEAA